MYTLNCKGRLLVIEQPIVMGILNITPDSFYSGSRTSTNDTILAKAEQMLQEGATILDMGGQSTRPGSTRLTVAEEAERVVPAVQLVKKNFPECFVSVDTYHSDVAREAVEAGADMVNDISAGEMDAAMLSTIARLQVPYIAMHMQGTPDTMQQNPVYENVTREVLDYFIKKTEQCRAAGFSDVLIDPGFGFGKTIAHNFQLLRELEAFQILKQAVLVGLSRKSTIYKTLGTTADDALNGTTVLNTIALQNGASVLRVHDVKEAMEAIQLVTAVYKK
ncbi:dihydropteroate synthase [Lacibacter sp. MH-610]|uniref:dihydropteroate synthase n=1 Tax=Lacibacter sp. MH-610 TaxID=3020883 RepID=UPI003892789F